MKIKKRLTQAEEFEIMKLILDKFLWLGTVIMGLGLYFLITGKLTDGVYFLFSGVVVLVLFTIIMVREYEIIK